MSIIIFIRFFLFMCAAQLGAGFIPLKQSSVKNAFEHSSLTEQRQLILWRSNSRSSIIKSQSSDYEELPQSVFDLGDKVRMSVTFHNGNEIIVS